MPALATQEVQASLKYMRPGGGREGGRERERISVLELIHSLSRPT